MTCRMCGSENVNEFKAEVAVHVPGLKNIDIPPAFLFSSLVICFDCGAAQFDIPEDEVRALQKRKAAGAE